MVKRAKASGIAGIYLSRMVHWIADNDDPDNDDMFDITEYITVNMVADITGVNASDIAFDIVMIRRGK